MGMAMYLIGHAVHRIPVCFQVVDLVLVTIFADFDFLAVLVIMAIVAFFTRSKSSCKHQEACCKNEF